ncbi:sterol desaturase family protein [Emticicia sp. CRIBPO]|uniref:sterol desaturase family protein n=1 Tax=Emticicia sp. CRIBPO TaxID=2683258 RepID=UPI001413253B|nr:sterol desaturase family protein [Emticicia sp. CRIBPO]NBA85715.1 sterol desaturase family protein [Emticicia sp. CRIBPO]
MEILQGIYDWLISFLGLGGLIKLYQSGDYSSLKTIKGFSNLIYPIVPFLLVIELIKTILNNKFKKGKYFMTFLIFFVNGFIRSFISIGMVAICTNLFLEYAIIETSFTWYWLIYGYIVWEFGHFIYHYFGHKVRIFWCLHSTHHAPQHMNLSVSFAHFFLEAPYADAIRTTVCILLGVNPVLLAFIMFVDGTWGNFIHAGEDLIKDARFGFVGKVILTPSHHRVHHAKNPLYMDTNFCNLLNIWDRVFKTYQEEKRDMQIEYGITREMNPNNFFDVYFGEFMALGNDIANAPDLKSKILYVFMPPGWSHTGDHKTARVVREEYIGSVQRS